MQVDISKRSFRIAWQHHVRSVGKTTANRITGVGGTTWSETKGQQSCALRLSIALAWTGVHFPRIKNSWRLKGTNVYFPTQAGDFPGIPLLANGEAVEGSVAERQATVKGRMGVVYFGAGFARATGHLTLWDGVGLHFPDIDDYWRQPKVVFWQMAQ